MARLVQYPSVAHIPKPPVGTAGWAGSSVDVLAGRTVLVETSVFVGPPAPIPANTRVNWQTINPEVFRSPVPFSAALQQFAAFQPFGVVLPGFGWWGQQLDLQFAKPFPIGDQPFTTAPEPEQFLPGFGWWGYQLDARFAKPFPAAEQLFSPSFEPQGFIQSTFPDGWRGLQWDYRFAQPFPAPAQQFLAHGPEHVPIALDVEGWYGIQLEYRFASPFPVADQQYVAQVAERVPRAADVQGFFGWQWDYQFKAPFPIGDQPFTTAPEPEQFLPGFGWWGQQLDARFAQPFPVPEQQFQALPSRHVPLPVDAQGFFGFQWDYQFAKPFPIGDQPFTTAPEPEQFLPGFGWWGYQLDARFARTFPVSAQQYSAHVPEHVRQAVDAQGWWGWQLEPGPGTIRTPFPASAQQYVAQTNRPIPVFPQFGWWGWQLEPGPATLRAPFPVASQLFQAWPAEEVPLFFPPGSGGYRLLPPLTPQPPYGVKPAKPFRPVWDRGAETADISAEIEPRPVPPVPAEIFARAPIPRLDGFVLPSFDHLVPPDVEDLARRYRAAMDASDAAAVLEAFANQPPEAEPAPQPNPTPEPERQPEHVPIIVPAPPIGAPPDQHLRDAEDIRAVMLRLMGGQPEPQSAALRTTVHRRASPRIVPAPAIGAEDPERDARDIEDILRILTAAGLGKK